MSPSALQRAEQTSGVLAKADAPTPPPPQPGWIPDFKNAIFFLAGVYAAEKVREAERYAGCSGHSLSAEEIARHFRNAAQCMTERIQRTTNTGRLVDCPDCSRGYVYVGPGRSPDDWARCGRCDGTATIERPDGGAK